MATTADVRSSGVRPLAGSVGVPPTRAAIVAFRRLINDLRRMGLDRMEHREASAGPPFRTATYRLGARVPSLDNVAELLATSEAEDWR